jgi:hypothetical protein
MIVNALEIFGWNRRRSAAHLNIGYRTLLCKIQYRLKPWFAADARLPMTTIPSSPSSRQNSR